MFTRKDWENRIRMEAASQAIENTIQAVEDGLGTKFPREPPPPRAGTLCGASCNPHDPDWHCTYGTTWPLWLHGGQKFAPTLPPIALRQAYQPNSIDGRNKVRQLENHIRKRLRAHRATHRDNADVGVDPSFRLGVDHQLPGAQVGNPNFRYTCGGV